MNHQQSGSPSTAATRVVQPETKPVSATMNSGLAVKIPSDAQSRTLDVGCGPFKLPGAIGLDKLAVRGVDIVCDLNRYPWPLEDNSFDRVVCRHVISHLNNVVDAMEELHRITRPGGRVEIVVPHFSSDNAFTDVTTRCFFGYRSMDYFCVDRPLKYRYSSKEFRLLEWHISFRQARHFEDQKAKFNPLAAIGLEQLINHFPRIYEHFLAFLMRANEVYFCLEVLK